MTYVFLFLYTALFRLMWVKHRMLSQSGIRRCFVLRGVALLRAPKVMAVTPDCMACGVTLPHLFAR